MPKPGKNSDRRGSLGFEKELWEAADLLRGNVDPSEYKHVVLGLLFLKYISDAFEERKRELEAKVADPKDREHYYVEDPEERAAELEILLADPEEFTGVNVFWVPKKARWEELQSQAKDVEIGKKLNQAMDAIEAKNPRLRGILPKVFSRPGLDTDNLGKLIDRFSGIEIGGREARAKDVLGRVYEYFLGRFASAEGKGGGEFYTPESVVRLLVEMIEPFRGRVYDPCCGSGGMFVQSIRFVEAHGGQLDEVSIYGQESNHTTWRLAQMNLAIRGIDADLGDSHADSFRKDLHKDLKADYILANPPFNVSEWHGDKLRKDPRWKHGAPPVGNANFAWVQHIAHHLAPGGVAGFVLANGSMSSMQGGEGEIREKLVKANLVDCMVALPPQLFFTTQIPVCLWFLARNRENGKFRKRTGEVLFIDARRLGEMETRVHRVFSAADLERIAGTYHAWRSKGKRGGTYEDVQGFCKSATVKEIASHDFVLTPGRYVGIEEEEGEVEPFGEKMERLTASLSNSLTLSRHLDDQIREQLGSLGFHLD